MWLRNIARRSYARLAQQATARHNLHFLLRDHRALTPRLSSSLIEAALGWPVTLPAAPRTILDVGAYTGQVAAQLSELYRPEFIGLVEPLPDLAAELVNRQLAPQQKVFPCAVGRARGQATLHIIASRHSSSLLPITEGCGPLFRMPMYQTGTLQVPVRTLDDIFDECGLHSLDLLKIDIQGYEIEAFAGGSRMLQRTRAIVTEVSFFEHYHGQPLFRRVYDHITSAGFELRGMYEWSYDSRGLPLQCDAMFIRREALA